MALPAGRRKGEQTHGKVTKSFEKKDNIIVKEKRYKYR